MEPPRTPKSMIERDTDITATVLRERTKLGNFIRRRVHDQGDAEDILQDVFHEFVQAYRLPAPIEQVSAWLFRVARNRIIDRFRSKRRQVTHQAGREEDTAGTDGIEDLLPAPGGGPEAALMRDMLLAEIEAALAELPPEQREVFVAQELSGVSFRELSERSGVSINTLLSRKRYAVRFLRERLQAAWDEWLIT